MPDKILIVRNDKLGDFVLALPVFKFLKQAFPQSQLHALIPKYTQPVAKCCPYIDEVIIDTNNHSKSFMPLFKAIKAKKYDAVITLYSTTRVGLAVWLAGIPQRYAPATKLAQVFYNNCLTQRRSRSEKPEYQYNLDLAAYYATKQQYSTAEYPVHPYLKFNSGNNVSLRETFYKQYNIPAEHRLIFIHPGSGGSATNLSITQYAQLANQLTPVQASTLVISCGPGERDIAEQVADQVNTLPYVIYYSTEGLEMFARYMQLASLFISGSTGPLHLAGALDVPTAAFYTRRRSATSLRWQTLNSEQNRLAFSPPEENAEEDMQSINIEMAANAIKQHYSL